MRPQINRKTFLHLKIHPEKSLFGRELMWKSTVLFDAGKYFIVLSLERPLHFNRRKVKNFALSLQKKSALTDRKTK